MNERYAYAQGAAQKLAEFGISPQQFIQAALDSGDPTAIKVAALIDDGFGNLVDTAPPVPGRMDRIRAQAGGLAEQAGGYMGDLAGRVRGANKLHMALGGAGLLAGAGGLAYGMGDADTYGNQARNMSNNYLGTDFDTQSRLGYGAEQLRNRFG